MTSQLYSKNALIRAF